MMHVLRSTVSLVSLSLLLSACGGSSGGSSKPTPGLSSSSASSVDSSITLSSSSVTSSASSAQSSEPSSSLSSQVSSSTSSEPVSSTSSSAQSSSQSSSVAPAPVIGHYDVSLMRPQILSSVSFSLFPRAFAAAPIEVSLVEVDREGVVASVTLVAPDKVEQLSFNRVRVQLDMPLSLRHLVVIHRYFDEEPKVGDSLTSVNYLFAPLSAPQVVVDMASTALYLGVVSELDTIAPTSGNDALRNIKAFDSMVDSARSQIGENHGFPSMEAAFNHWAEVAASHSQLLIDAAKTPVEATLAQLLPSGPQWFMSDDGEFVWRAFDADGQQNRYNAAAIDEAGAEALFWEDYSADQWVELTASGWELVPDVFAVGDVLAGGETVILDRAGLPSVRVEQVLARDYAGKTIAWVVDNTPMFAGLRNFIDRDVADTLTVGDNQPFIIANAYAAANQYDLWFSPANDSGNCWEYESESQSFEEAGYNCEMARGLKQFEEYEGHYGYVSEFTSFAEIINPADSTLRTQQMVALGWGDNDGRVAVGAFKEGGIVEFHVIHQYTGNDVGGSTTPPLVQAYGSSTWIMREIAGEQVIEFAIPKDFAEGDVIDNQHMMITLQGGFLRVGELITVESVLAKGMVFTHPEFGEKLMQSIRQAYYD